MNIPGAPMLRAEDFPDSDPRLLDVVSRALRQIRDSVASLPVRNHASGDFTSAASGVSTLLVANSLPTKPTHVSLALRRDDLADFSAAWSWWYALQNGQIKLSFIGLPASTKLVYSVEFF